MHLLTVNYSFCSDMKRLLTLLTVTRFFFFHYKHLEGLNDPYGGPALALGPLFGQPRSMDKLL